MALTVSSMSSHPVAPPTTAKMAMTTMSRKHEQSLPHLVGLPRSESAITTVVEPVRRLQPVYALLAELGVARFWAGQKPLAMENIV